MTRRASVSVDGLRERFRRLHGPSREEAAHSLALLDCASEVLRQAIDRRLRAERLFEFARGKEAERWASLVARAEAEADDPPRRPVWLGSTWRALEALAAASAKESEWFEIVTDCARAAARARDKLRPPDRALVFHVESGGNDGQE